MAIQAHISASRLLSHITGSRPPLLRTPPFGPGRLGSQLLPKGNLYWDEARPRRHMPHLRSPQTSFRPARPHFSPHQAFLRRHRTQPAAHRPQPRPIRAQHTAGPAQARHGPVAVPAAPAPTLYHSAAAFPHFGSGSGRPGPGSERVRTGSGPPGRHPPRTRHSPPRTGRSSGPPGRDPPPTSTSPGILRHQVRADEAQSGTVVAGLAPNEFLHVMGEIDVGRG